MKKFLILVNPSKKGLVDVKNELNDYAHSKQVELIYQETIPNEKIVPPLEIDGVVAVGGDGTFYHVVNQIENLSIPISFIPNGTGNDFVKTLDIGKRKEDVIKAAFEGSLIKIDLGLCNNKRFLNGVGIGFDGEIVKDMLHKKTFLKGHAAYYYHVLRIISSYPTQQLVTDVHGVLNTEEIILMTIANGTTFGGGFMLTPHGDITDGLLSFCTVGDVSAIRRFINLHLLQSGTHDRMPEVTFGYTRSVHIEKQNQVVAHADGEYLGHPPFHISVIPKALTIRAYGVQPSRKLILSN